MSPSNNPLGIQIAITTLIVLFSLGVGMLAQKRGRRAWLWAILSLFFNPVFMGLIVILSADKSVKPLE